MSGRQNRGVLSFCLNDAVDHSCWSSVGSLFQACGAATKKALLPIRRLDRGMLRSLQHDARSDDHAGISDTGVIRAAI